MARANAKPVRRGRPPTTSRREIAEAALQLARDEGLDAVTIRRLAQKLGRAPMTLYNYELSKEEIIDLMVATALESFDYQPDPDAPWREQMYTFFARLYETLRENPVIIELLTRPRAVMGPAVDHTRDKLLATMASTPLPPQRAVNVFNTIGAYVVGLAAVESGRARRADELSEHLKTLPRRQYPAVARSPTVWAQAIPRDMIDQGLRVLIDRLTESAEEQA
jgi:AcrR family transcriptional regulator